MGAESKVSRRRSGPWKILNSAWVIVTQAGRELYSSRDASSTTWDRANLVTTRVHLGKAPLSDLLVYDEVADGAVTGLPCPPRRGRRYSFSHGSLRVLASTGS